MDPHLAAKIAPYVVPVLVIALVARRLIKNPPRKVKPIRLFVTPVLLVLVTAFTLSQTGWPSLAWLGIDALAAAAGAGVGYLNARHRDFSLDAESGEIMARATPIGTVIFAALFALRFGLKLLFPQMNGGAQPYGPPPPNFHPAGSVIGWADAGLVFSTAMLLATAATTWLRTRHLMAERRARRAAKAKVNASVGAEPKTIAESKAGPTSTMDPSTAAPESKPNAEADSGTTA
jgi:protein-S-isoprenylcysteine O-methyltransferase Ste14